MPLVTATFSTGGNVIIDDTTEVAAINALTAAVTANTAMLEKLFGPAGAQLPGGITASAAGSTGQLLYIYNEMTNLSKSVRELNVAVGDISKEIDIGNRGLANINTNMTKQLTTQQVALVDQMKHNQFQQTSTNAALADAGKEPVVVPQQNWVDKVKVTVQDVGDVKSQVAVAGWVEGYLTETVTEANKELLKWAAETEIGKGAIKLWADLKAKTKTIFASAEATTKSNITQATTIVTTKSAIAPPPVVTPD